MPDPKFNAVVEAENALVASTVSEPLPDPHAALLAESGALIADRLVLVSADALTPEADSALKRRAGDLARRMRALGPPSKGGSL